MELQERVVLITVRLAKQQAILRQEREAEQDRQILRSGLRREGSKLVSLLPQKPFRVSHDYPNFLPLRPVVAEGITTNSQQLTDGESSQNR